MHSLTGQEARQHALGESRERIDGDYGQAYHYDTRGNLTFRDGWGGAGQLAAVTYDAKNQRPGQVHDAAGNMTSDGYTSFAYDATGREASASSGVTHTYDGDLMRIKRVENGQTTLYLRSSVMGGAVIAEMNAQGNWTRGYVYGESGGLTAIQQPEGYVEWVTQDPVTKGQRITNAAGTVTAALEFDPFGGETSKSVNSYRQPQKYTTYTRDSNGTDDAMHRRYIAYWSRFQQPDPYDGSYNLADPQSFNRYAYVGNDPVNFVDPSGLNMSAGSTTCYGSTYTLTTYADGVAIGSKTWTEWSHCVTSGGGATSYSGGYGGGSGGTATAPQSASPTPQPDPCADALKVANKDMSAVNRAYAAVDILNRVGNANGIYPKLLAAIGVRETGFQNVSQRGGNGRGIFQIDIGANPQAANIAGDTEAAATFAAQFLVGRINYHASADRGYPSGNYNADLRLGAGVRDYNARHSATRAAMNTAGATISSLDSGTARNNYVTNVLNIATHCFNR